MNDTQVTTIQASTVNIRQNIRKKSRFIKFIRSYPMVIVGGAMVLLLMIVANLAPVIAKHDPITQYEEGLTEIGTPVEPNDQFILGTDGIGRDAFARIVHGSIVSLQVGIFASLISLFIGVLMGIVSGYFGGWVDMVIMRITDTMLAFPFLLFVIALVAVLKPSITNVYLAIGILGWSSMARIVRGEVLKVKQLEYVQAAKALGSSSFPILFIDILPNITGPVLVMGTLAVGQNIMLEAALSFLGIGVQPPTASWGNMLQEGMRIYQIAPWMIFGPGLALLWATLGFNLLGDGLRDLLDPKTGR